MLRKAILILLSLFMVPVFFAHAQESPFGNLSSGDTIATEDRLVLSPEGQTKGNYLETLNNYKNLVSLYEKAYGQRRVDLEKQIIARGKDVLISKIGALKTYLAEVYNDSKQTGMLSEAGEVGATAILGVYDQYFPKPVEEINLKTTRQDLIDYNNVLNRDLATFSLSVRPQIALISISYGQRIINLIEDRAPVIQEHIYASADMGGNVGDIQKMYDEAMLDLEKAKDGYEEITTLAASGAPTETRTFSSLASKTDSVNGTLRKSYDGLVEVLNQLRIIYGQSPWKIDSTKFDFGSEE